MKNKLLLCFTLLLGVTLCAQTSLMDGEQDGGTALPDVILGASGPGAAIKPIVTLETNSWTGGINTSANCYKIETPVGSASWNVAQFGHTFGVTSKANYPIIGSEFVKFKVLSTTATTLDLRVDLAQGQLHETKSITLEANTWQEVFFDLTTNNAAAVQGTIPASHTNLRININPGSGGAGEILYVDDYTYETPLYVSQSDGDYNSAANWLPATVPYLDGNVDLFHNMTYTGDITVDHILVRYQKSLNVTGSFTANTASEIYGGGSLITSGTTSGDFTTYVEANDTNWHLISSPVVGEQYNDDNAASDWVSTNNIATGTNSNLGIGTYDNGTPDIDNGGGDTATEHWRYFQANGAATTFGSGVGYSLKKSTGGNYTFIGTLKNDNLLMTINQDDNDWNLVGNPYSSYLLVSDIIDDNTANLTDTHEFVYVFNNNKVGGAGYETLDGTDYINPGQAFFVNADNSNANNFTILKSKQNIRIGNPTFYKNSLPSIKLYVKDANGEIEYTEVSYKSNATTSLDKGLDAGTFTGVASSFNIYSHLVENSKGVNFMKQVLPNSDFETMVIPVGVKAEAGKEITFSVDALNFPSGINVYLEDKITNTFTRLDKANSNYKVTLESTLEGIGRFYLHTKPSVLNTADVLLENISIYKTNNSNLRVVGLQKGNATIKLYNILGKQMITTSFEANEIKNISLPNLAKGVYIVQLSNETGKLNKKIIIE